MIWVAGLTTILLELSNKYRIYALCFNKKYIVISQMDIYLVLTVYAVRTVSYELSFFSSPYGHKKRGGKRGSITYSTDQANEVNKMFIIWL